MRESCDEFGLQAKENKKGLMSALCHVQRAKNSVPLTTRASRFAVDASCASFPFTWVVIRSSCGSLPSAAGDTMHGPIGHQPVAARGEKCQGVCQVLRRLRQRTVESLSHAPLASLGT